MRIYLLTCRTSGKRYVGQTIDSLEQRWKEHVDSTCDGRTLLYRAMRKYGADSFERQVLEECTTFEQLDERERHWIAELVTLKPNGYNMTLGGQGCHGYRHTVETRKHLSEINKGRVFSDEHRANLTIAHTGRRHTEETKRKCSEATRRRKPKLHPDGCTCKQHTAGISRRALGSDDVQNARRWHDSGMTWKQIAERLQVSTTTLVRSLKRD